MIEELLRLKDKQVADDLMQKLAITQELLDFNDQFTTTVDDDDIDQSVATVGEDVSVSSVASNYQQYIHQTLKGFNNTRWNSTQHKIKSFLQLSSQVNSVIKQMGKYDQCIVDDDFDVLKQLCSFLKPFEEMTKLVSVVGPSMSFIPLFKQKIKKMCKIMDYEDASIKRLKQLVFDYLDKRLSESEACKVAMFLILAPEI